MDTKPNIKQTIDHLFRQESGKMVAVLTKIFGTENITLVEDVVQDALVSALQTWKFGKLPDNPRAWLYRTAKNKAIDLIRRNKHNQLFDFSVPDKQPMPVYAPTMENLWQEDHIKDDFLGMMFACCHPGISQENQTSFILKVLGGFSTKEVARAFLTTEDTISKRVYRTKEYFRKHKTRPQIPDDHQIQQRTSAVLHTIYLMFNEGYNSTHSDELIRQDLISQAMLLCKSLLENPKTQLPEVYALMALMCLHSARINSRLTPKGELILLPEQDRNNWNQDLIQLGNDYLNQAAFGNKVSHYHLEAAIAYEHCIAPRFENTNWKAIFGYYEALLSIAFDPIVFLNRCLVMLELHGPKAALKELTKIENQPQIQKYYVYHSAMGEIHQRLGNKEEAVDYLLQALTLTQSEQEKGFLKEKIARISAQQ